MKQTGRIYPVLILILALILILPSCTKKKISSQPAVTSAAELEAQKKAAEEARQRELAKQRAIQEENLKEQGLKESGLSAEMAEERKLTERAVFENEDIHFEFDSIILSQQAQDILRKKAQYLKENPNLMVTIEGHCDSRGTNEYNMALGDRRAYSAKTFLVDLGINESRLRTVSYGEERPLDPAENEEAYAKNRRDHFVITN
jgi:peptidoglycan-associated lipoprotein